MSKVFTRSVTVIPVVFGLAAVVPVAVPGMWSLFREMRPCEAAGV
ncbi:hypothetical protein ACFFX0_20415 [Citricoccus parietis]|uniref:Uncharacterized protein n=1 Tax=Citricoccus parietis TaxID=592307 RepID=A0ABV5G3C7_9MICC